MWARGQVFIALNDKEVFWFFIAVCPPKGMEKGADPEMIQRKVMENLAKDFQPVYLDVVKHSDLLSLTWAPLMFRYPWDILFGNLVRSNVTVAGDNAPDDSRLGLGGRLALEDAVALGRHLGDSIAKHGKLVTRDIGFAIGRYAKERRSRAATLITTSYLLGWVQQDGSSQFMRFLRDVVFYGLLLGRVVNGFIGYDCGKLPGVSSLPSCESENSI
ncbi:monooxygenase 2-like [Eucalyptus grandis]|uniref:monooxygenase 2-like n=1 Tax=Eucalyptus grandis TaxID=71139 RepID=UPI00192E8CC7|nr:monooxygenase 2-like [Eucalyptus grandis]